MKYRGILLLAVISLGACGGGGSSGGGTSVSAGGGTGGGTTGGGTAGGGGISTGGGFDFDTGIGGSGGIIGDIDGFGSILMNGLVLDTDDAEFFIEDQSGSQDDLREGQYIVVAGDVSGSIAEEVVYRSNLKGPVSAAPVPIDPLAGVYELTVLDQTVLTGAATRFDGVLAENIVQGDLLEVSGPIDQQGRVLATYIGLKAALSEYKAIGRVSSLNTTSETFDLGGLQVGYGAAALEEFEGAGLADGQLVQVKISTGSYPASGAVPVTEVELLPEAQLSEGAEIEIEGVIDSFSSATEFSVGGLPVTTDSGTEFEDGGSAAQLGLNVRVEVEGTVNAAGIIVAEDIEFEDEPVIRIEGEVTAVDVNGGTVTAMGLTFEVRASTEMEDDRDDVEPFMLDDLMNGDYVEIRGFLDGTDIIAVELEREETPAAGEFRAMIRGPLTAIDEPNSTVDIQNVTVTEAVGTTEYEDADEQTVGRAAFYGLLEPGLELEAEWEDFSSFALPADTLSLEDDD